MNPTNFETETNIFNCLETMILNESTGKLSPQTKKIINKILAISADEKLFTDTRFDSNVPPIEPFEENSLKCYESLPIISSSEETSGSSAIESKKYETLAENEVFNKCIEEGLEVIKGQRPGFTRIQRDSLREMIANSTADTNLAISFKAKVPDFQLT